MKISYNWLKEYLDTDLKPQELSELLTDIGLEVEDLTEYKGPGNGLQGLVIGHVQKTEKHPDADKLKLTWVDVGTGEVQQIVCGAANVAEGQKVIVALPGTTLYPAKGESFTIKKAKIRGVESNGMICAEDEIGLGTSHEGIMVLPDSVQVGTKVRDYFELKDDFIFEIGLTPNRTDAFSHIGVARDLRAAINVRFNKNLSLNYPKTDKALFNKTEKPIEVIVEDAKLCPRYSGILLKNVQVAESPNWLKEKLRSVGQRPINNIVDITNFILQEFGQPLHAFDADAIKGNKVIVKTLPEKSKFKTLDETERELSSNDLMICNAEEGMCIAGVFGGLHSGVTNATRNIFLESAHFNSIAIRKTANRHGLRTDAAMRFEKGTDPNITVIALQRAVQLILQVAGGEVASAIVDVYPQPVPHHEVNLRYAQLDKLIGFQIDGDIIHDILEQLGIEVKSETQEALQLSVPPFKVDVQREADVIEEILRIYGVNRIPLPDSIRTSISHRTDVDLFEAFKNSISDYLSSIGFREMINNSLSREKYYKWDEYKTKLVRLQKSENSDLGIMRTEMLFSALEVVEYNINRNNKDLKFFEIGKTYEKNKDNNYKETRFLSIAVTGMKHPENWIQKSRNSVDIHFLISIVDNILTKFGVTVDPNNSSQIERPYLLHAPFPYWVDQTPVAHFGEVSLDSLIDFDIKQKVFFADIYLDNVFNIAKKQTIQFKEIPRFPGVRRDLALLIKDEISFAAIEKIAAEEGRKLLKAVNLFDVYKDDKLGAGVKSYAVSYLFEDAEKTLTDKDVEKLMQKLMTRYREELQAEIR